MDLKQQIFIRKVEAHYGFPILALTTHAEEVIDKIFQAGTESDYYYQNPQVWFVFGSDRLYRAHEGLRDSKKVFISLSPNVRHTEILAQGRKKRPSSVF